MRQRTAAIDRRVPSDRAGETLTVTELRGGLSAALDRVQRGARIALTHRGRVVAMLVPPEYDDGVRVVPARRPFVNIRNKRYTPPRNRFDPLAALLVERGER